MTPWRIATFNVNGIRARLEAVLAWLKQNPWQVVALQEIKVQEQDFPYAPFIDMGLYVSVLGQKSFNGVALLSQQKPDELRLGLPGQEHQGARFMAARFGRLWVLNSYVPQGRDAASPFFQEKLAFIRGMGQYLQSRHSPQEHIIWLGDINVAPEAMDVYDPVRLKGQMGFHPEEQAALAQVMDVCGLTDLFRSKNPGAKAFSFWDYRAPNGFKRDLGWRIDHLLVSVPLLNCCEACWIEKDLRGAEKPSDHAPVGALFNLPAEIG